MCDLLLLYFLLQGIKFWRGKKLTKGGVVHYKCSRKSPKNLLN